MTMYTYIDCDAFVYSSNELRNKLDAKSIKSILLKYDEGEMGYRIWLPQLKNAVHTLDAVYNQAKLFESCHALKNHNKNARLQCNQPSIEENDMPQMES